MKKKISKQQEAGDSDMLPEYEFKDGIRGKHFRAYRQGHTVKIHKVETNLGTGKILIIIQMRMVTLAFMPISFELEKE